MKEEKEIVTPPVVRQEKVYNPEAGTPVAEVTVKVLVAYASEH